MDREAIINEIFDRVMDEREMTLSEIIEAEHFDTYVPGRVDFLYVEDLFTSVVPCHGKVIIVRDRYDSAACKHVAEYAIYNLTDKDTFGTPIDRYWDKEVIYAEAVYKFDHVCTEVFDNQALAVAHAVNVIYGKEN